MKSMASACASNTDTAHSPLTRRPGSANLCGDCHPLIARMHFEYNSDRSESPLYIPLQHHQTLADLKRSAATGCGLCTQSVNNLRPWPGTGWEGKKENASLYIYPDSVSFLMKVWDNVGILGDENRTRVLGSIFEVYPTGHKITPSVSSQPNTEEALLLCKSWLRDCCATHDTCHPPSPRFKPTRIIYVGDNLPRLYLASEVDHDVRFASLSHCWGKLKFQTLTRRSLNSFRIALPLEALTKTFRDAIAICQTLGIDWLWIDSLCIIQDDVKDWERESVLMTSVYGGCDLNIAATSAEDGSVGCFFPRTDGWLSQVTRSDVHRNTEKIYNILPLGWAKPRNSLNYRAWVFQERYLSRRTLHFTDNQVFWECDGRISCEAFGMDNLLGTPATEPYLYSFALNRRPLCQSTWPGLVTRYSECLLTKTTDRLIAIAGLAESIRKESQDEYIAGMWKSQLAESLHHLTWHPGPKSKRIEGSTSPSWSWGGIMGFISYPGEQEDETDPFQVMGVGFHDVQHDRNGSSPFGIVSNAVLRLKCKALFQATFKCTKVKNVESGGFLFFTGRWSGLSVHNKPGSAAIDCTSLHDELPDIDVFVLFLGRSTRLHWWKLLLLVRHGASSGHFRRIGTTCCHDSGPYISGTSIKTTGAKEGDQFRPPNKTGNKSEKALSSTSDGATSMETDRLSTELDLFGGSDNASPHSKIDTSVCGSDDYTESEETDRDDEEDPGHIPLFPLFSDKDNLFNSLDKFTIDSSGVVHHHHDLFSEITYDTDGTKNFIIDLV